MNTPIISLVALLLGAAIGYGVRQYLASNSKKSIETEARALLADAQKKQEEKLVEVKKIEEKLFHKEDLLSERDRALLSREKELEKKRGEYEQKLNLVNEADKRIQNELSRVSKFSIEEARKELFKKMEEVNRDELIRKVKELEGEKRDAVEKKSVEIITSSIQRYSRAHIVELTTTTYMLPNEEIMGKIIGKEGRNIRAFERATGVELITDESPDVVVISSFDPLRREIARLALDKLIKDGRIQPAKIEEKVEESKQELEKRMKEVGEQAAIEVGVVGLHEDIIKLLGRLYFRTSYGQNVLVHSIEMAHIAGMLAKELGLNVEIAKKAALLHDIGKALSHEVEGTHVEIGRKLLKKYNVDELVIQAMEAHHEEYPFSTPESFLIGAADVISAGRPGARRDTVENYFKRLENLEKIATGFPGVKNAYALSAGREIRVFVVPEKIDDFGAFQLAKDIANRVQAELKFPGEIKVNSKIKMQKSKA